MPGHLAVQDLAPPPARLRQRPPPTVSYDPTPPHLAALGDSRAAMLRMVGAVLAVAGLAPAVAAALAQLHPGSPGKQQAIDRLAALPSA